MFFARMPAKCREILWMRRIQGIPQREVAQRVGMTEGAVEKHVHRGVRYLADAMYGSSQYREAGADDDIIENGPRYGD